MKQNYKQLFEKLSESESVCFQIENGVFIHKVYDGENEKLIWINENGTKSDFNADDDNIQYEGEYIECENE
jgi:hypothetical protein